MNYDTTQVVNPVSHIQDEIDSITGIIKDIEQNILKLTVQKAKMEASRDCIIAGLKALHNAEPAEKPEIHELPN